MVSRVIAVFKWHRAGIKPLGEFFLPSTEEEHGATSQSEQSIRYQLRDYGEFPENGAKQKR